MEPLFPDSRLAVNYKGFKYPNPLQTLSTVLKLTRTHENVQKLDGGPLIGTAVMNCFYLLSLFGVIFFFFKGLIPYGCN